MATQKERQANAVAVKKAVDNGCAMNLVVRWTKSRTWGRNPIVECNGMRLAQGISGCGYNKESAALAQALHVFGDGDAMYRASGAGVEVVREVLEANGYVLESSGWDATTDIYTIRKKEKGDE